MTAAIYYHPEGYSTRRENLMGRHAAGESFLRGFLRHSTGAEFWAMIGEQAHGEEFSRQVRAAGRSEPTRLLTRSAMGELAQPGCYYLPGPGVGEQAWQRAYFGHGQWSLCGITHTTCSDRVMTSLCDLLTAPVQSWDAVICTSKAVRENVVRLIQGQADYLSQRLGASRVVMPMLPVIPLGVHCDDFAIAAPEKAEARRQLGIDAETLVVLFLGRLTFTAKSHPLAMYQALQSAARECGKRLLLVECGWFPHQGYADSFDEAAALACPDVARLHLDGRKPDERRRAWAAADIFCSLSDNIQETFGLVPLEAMAAGLPVVVSDWDGYRDTVRHGVDGFRVPTVMPEAGLGRDLAMRYGLELDNYDRYCGYVGQFTAVDVGGAAQALAELIRSPELRRSMGEAGRARARSEFDWAAIIPQYEALWRQQAEIRQREASSLPPLRHPWPARPDPFHVFGGYATQTLTRDLPLGLVGEDVQSVLGRLRASRSLRMVSFADGILPDLSETEALLAAFAAGPRTPEQVLGSMPENRRPALYRALSWLVKLGLLRLA